MKILCNKLTNNISNDIGKELKKIKPTKVAVAYIGKDWKNHLPSNKLQAIVLSPTIGSNPDAVQELVDELGWEKVHFLDNLHAKIYIGSAAALVGSANLSSNALGDDEQKKRIEVAVLCESAGSLKELNKIFQSILTQAKDAYPDDRVKKERLYDLGCQYKEVNSKRKKVASVKFGSYMESSQIREAKPFKVVWWEDTLEDHEYSIRVEKRNEKAWGNRVANWLGFARQDSVCPGEWLLTWKADKDCKCPDIPELSWLYIHDIRPEDGVDDYPKIAIQWKEKCTNKYTPRPPFNVNTKGFKGAFSRVMNLDKYAALRPPADDRVCCLKDTEQAQQEFVNDVFSEYRRHEHDGRESR